MCIIIGMNNKSTAQLIKELNDRIDAFSTTAKALEHLHNKWSIQNQLDQAIEETKPNN